MSAHVLYETKDVNRPSAICDANGEVALALCKVCGKAEGELVDHPICHGLKPKFHMGDMVCKISGSQWHGKIVGTYSTELTPEGYAVESATERGSVQIYPAKALTPWDGQF